MNKQDRYINTFSFDFKLLWVPACVLIVLTLILRVTSLDLMISHLFFVPEQGFALKKSYLAVFLYKRGNLPAFALALSGIVLIVKGRLKKQEKYWSKPGLFLVVFLVLGPGLIVHTVFKDHWGRPRPRQIVEFNANQTYLKVWQKGVAGQGKSFPSGHAGIGYFVMAPFFIFYPNGRKRLALSCLVIGLGYGSVMGLCRVVQGAHFFSDILWSAGFVYYTGLFLSFGFFGQEIVDMIKRDLKIKQ